MAPHPATETEAMTRYIEEAGHSVRELPEFAKDRDFLTTLYGDMVLTRAFDVILDHVDHAVSVVGTDHVGIGTDLDVPHMSTPEGFDDVTAFPKLTAGLTERGYSNADVEKIMGGNWLRVFGEVTEGAA